VATTGGPSRHGGIVAALLNGRDGARPSNALLHVVNELLHLLDHLGRDILKAVILLGVRLYFLHQLVHVLGSRDKVAVHSGISTTDLFHCGLLLIAGRALNVTDSEARPLPSGTAPPQAGKLPVLLSQIRAMPANDPNALKVSPNWPNAKSF